MAGDVVSVLNKLVLIAGIVAAVPVGDHFLLAKRAAGVRQIITGWLMSKKK